MSHAIALAQAASCTELAAPACFHCGLPVPVGIERTVRILGRSRPMCCSGCEAVARTIVEAGCESFYETRTGALPQPMQELPDAVLYDDPLAQRQFVASVGEHGREATLGIEGLRCPACAWLNERALRRLPGITGVSINYATRRAQVAWDERFIGVGAIVGAIRSLGYDAYPFEPGRQVALRAAEKRASLWRLFVAGFGAMQVMMYAFPRYIDDSGTLSAESEQVMRWASLVLTLPVILFSCGPFFRSALADLRSGRMGIDVPVSLGIAAGFATSVWATLHGSGEVYFDSITMLVCLLLASRHAEAAARDRASVALDQLARWMPSFAFRLREGSDSTGERIASHELREGDRVLIAPGETVPADGIVEHGTSSADESLLTGESRPVEKTAGATLIAGSVNVEQPVVMAVSGAGQDTQAAAISRLVERAAASKPRLVESADRVARSLTWVVLAVAATALLAWGVADPARAPWVAIAVLMVSCPCALGLAAPIALGSATGALARRGIAMTRARAIESLCGITDVVLDKTGTLTEGTLRLARVESLSPKAAEECVAIAKALESGSAHPIARALKRETANVSCPPSDPVHFAGQGIEARIEGHRVRLGNLGFVRAISGPEPALQPPTRSETSIYLGTESLWLARLSFADTLRPDAQALVDALRSQGLRLHLVSGDDEVVANDAARRLGIENVTGGALPADKHQYAKRLQSEGRRVLMVGDGLNDAPVLARADVSVAMGRGASLARQQADLVLLSGRLSGITEAMRIASLAMHSIRQNLGWALAYNAVAVPLAALGLVGPWEAAIGMAASSFLVVLNCARLEAALRTTA